MIGCRWCGVAGPGLVRVHLEAGSVVGARARRMARIAVLEHPACLARWEGAHAAAELVRGALHAAARELVAAGDLEGAMAVMGAAADVMDSQYLPPLP